MKHLISFLIVFALLPFLAFAQPAPPQNVNASPGVVCPGSATNLSATVVAPNEVRWFTQPSGGNSLGTSASGANFSVTPNGTTTYYAETVTPSGSINFGFTGNVQSWTVPAGVTSITVDASGASGADGTSPVVGGNGGRVQATLTVSPGQVLYLYVGGQGGQSSGGYNGGGASGTRRGGGATDIRTTLGDASTRILVAGGGGAASSSANGGDGGNPATAGQNGINFNAIVIYGGGGATTSTAGAAGTGTANGAAGTSAGVGGLGGNSAGGNLLCGGNGGGGYFGGGGGGANNTGNNKSAGGGGGSSFVSAAATNITYTTGANDGNGSVAITWTGTPSTSRVPVTVTQVGSPTNIQVSNITGTDADISWTATQGVGYQWKVVSTGAGPNATAIAGGSTPFVSLTVQGLSANTSYDLYLRSECAGSTFSAWSNPVSFSTTGACVAPAVFSMTGGGTFCDDGSAGVQIGLSGSETGVVYYLFLDGGATGISSLGDGLPLSFGYFNISGIYTVEAADVATGLCITTMADSATLSSQTPLLSEVNIAITAGSQSIVAGTSVTFTANPTNGGTSPSYQWLLNGNPVGADSTNYSNSVLADGDVVTCEMTSSESCVLPAVATSNSITLSVSPASSPTIDAFSPASGCAGNTPIVITGTNLAGTTAVSIGGTSVAAFTINSPTQITAIVGAGNTGTVSLTTTSGFATSTDSFTVNPYAPLPALITPASSPFAICNGTSTTLEVAALPNHTIEWRWFTGVAHISPMATSTANPLNTPNLTATRTYYAYQQDNTTGCWSEIGTPVRINLHALPPAGIAGPDRSVCPGGSVSIGPGTAVSGWTYSWYPATLLSSASLNRPTLQPVPMGYNQDYTLIVTTNNGCTRSDGVNVSASSITNLVAATNAGTDQTVCSGVAKPIGSAPTTGMTYTWTPSASLDNRYSSMPIHTFNNPSSTAASNIRYVLMVRETATGCVNRDTVFVTTNPLPAANRVNAGADQTIVAGATTTIGGANAVLGLSYSWTPPTALSNPNSAKPAANPAATTTYALSVTNSFGCTRTDSMTLTVSPLREGINSGISFSAYPNPVNEVLQLVSSQPLTDEVWISLSNELGQVVFERKVNLQQSVLQERIVTKELAPGVYLLHVSSGDKQQRFKILKN